MVYRREQRGVGGVKGRVEDVKGVHRVTVKQPNEVTDTAGMGVLNKALYSHLQDMPVCRCQVDSVGVVQKVLHV